METYGPAVLRLTAGAMFVAHGMQKSFGWWGGEGLGGTAAWLASLGLAPAFPLAVLVAVVELAGGLMLWAGLFTRSLSGILLVHVAIGMWIVHVPHGFFLNWQLTPGEGHGVQFSVLLIGVLAALVLTGPGALSVDAARDRSAESRAAGRARLRGTL